jgi:hypothetical protein
MDDCALSLIADSDLDGDDMTTNLSDSRAKYVDHRKNWEGAIVAIVVLRCSLGFSTGPVDVT